jgi:hypothetical protein
MAEGDRKANVDMLEANKVTNSEEIRRLKAENKESRAKLAQLQKVCLCLYRAVLGADVVNTSLSRQRVQMMKTKT